MEGVVCSMPIGLFINPKKYLTIQLCKSANRRNYFFVCVSADIRAERLRITSRFAQTFLTAVALRTRRATGGGAFGAFAPPEIFKTLHSNFDICRNFQRIKMKFYILIIFKKSYLNFSLFCSLIISLQDLSWDRLSDRKFRKWLVFNHKYAGSVNLGDSLNCSYF